jgi:2-keto-3-deoxy-6-phosphogluconate aldolase
VLANADETVAEYLSAGAALGGAGNTFLATEEEIQGKNWAAVQAKASAFVGAVKEWKAANPIPSL